MTACPYGDPFCPCQDGDACHYVDLEGSKGMKALAKNAARSLLAAENKGAEVIIRDSDGAVFIRQDVAERVIERLRAQISTMIDIRPMTGLIMPKLPSGWLIAKIEVRRNQAWCFNRADLTYDALLERVGGDYEARGSGPTSYDAVCAALQEISHVT